MRYYSFFFYLILEYPIPSSVWVIAEESKFAYRLENCDPVLANNLNWHGGD